MDWDFTAGISSWFKLSGTIAGFVFTAIILLLRNPPQDKNVKHTSEILYMLLIIFVSLMIVSFLFGIIMCDLNKLRGIALVTIAGIMFMFIFAQTLLSLVMLFKEYGIEPSILKGVRFIYYSVLLFISIQIVTTISTFHTYVYGKDARLLCLGIWLLLLVLGPIIGRFIKKKKTAFMEKKMERQIFFGSFIFILITGLYTGVLSYSSSAMLPHVCPLWLMYTLTAVIGIFFFLFELVLP